MPREEIALPAFNPDRPESSVYQTTGLVAKPISREKVAYVPSTGLSESAIRDFEIRLEYDLVRDELTDTAPPRIKQRQPNAGTELALPPLDLLRQFYTATQLPSTQQVVFLFYDPPDDSEQSTVYFIDILDLKKVKRLPLPHNATEDLPKLRAFPFVWQDEQHIIFSNGLILRVDSTALQEATTAQDYRDAVTVVETDIRGQALSDPSTFVVPEIHEHPIQDIEVRFNRLFVALHRTVHWCHPGNLARWDTREEFEVDDMTEERATLAGFFVLDDESVQALNSSDKSFLIFTKNEIHRAVISDPKIQFQVLPMAQSTDYLTGDITFHNGTYFLSRSGVKYLPSGGDNPVIISQPINERLLSLLRTKTPVTAAVVEDTSSVIWLFPSQRTIVMFNMKFETWQILEDVPAHVLGFSFTGITTIGDLAGQSIGSLTGTSIGDLSPRAESHTAIIIERPDGAGEVRFIGFYSPSYSFRVQIYKGTGDKRVVLQKVSLEDVRAKPGQVAYDVRYRNDPDRVKNVPISANRPGFSAPYRPNGRNECLIYKSMEEIDLEVNIYGEFTQLESIVVEATAELGAN